MKTIKLKLYAFLLSIIFFVITGAFLSEKNDYDNSNEDKFESKNEFHKYHLENFNNGPLNYAKNNLPAPKKDEPLEGPDLEKKYFSDWNYPYGAVLPDEVVSKIWNQTKAIKNETELGDAVVNSWSMIGPYGSVSQTTSARVSGRILDIEVGNTANPLLATASGGLWSYFGFLPVCISEDITSLVIGTVASNPGNSAIILIGTGEPNIRSGTGLWRSVNAGSTWTLISDGNNFGSFYIIRHQNFFADIVHAVTTTGYFRSTNGGLNWTKNLSSFNGSGISDIAINPNNPNIIYCGRVGDGIFKSTNNGLNFSKVTTPGIPTSDIGRVSLTIGTSNSNKIYAMIESATGDSTKGIFMTANDGASWTDVSPTSNVLGNQGWYNNVMGVCPTNSNIVLAGGVRLYRSANSGITWTQITDNDVHVDQHAIEWTANGSDVYIGNDGGVMVSYDQGVTYSSSINYLPITQYVNFDVGESNRGVIFGGSQDNGFTGTTNGGTSWIYTKGGDGGGVSVDPISSLNIYGTGGYYTDDHAFRIFKSTDQGLTWSINLTGIDPNTTWWTKMRNDRTNPIKLYTNAGGFVYESVDQGVTWDKLNNFAFAYRVTNIGVSKYVSPKAIIYATLNSNNTGNRIKVYDGGSFTERASGIPSGLQIREVVTHQTNTSTAYALINGFSDGNKVFKTTNKGVNWTNISGNLPDVPIGGLVPNRLFTNYLYLGTQAGCYRTTNAGVSWHRWNNGMPDATIVTEMKWIDSTLENGKRYVIASTYGRSFYVREVTSDDPENELTLSVFIEGFYNSSANLTIKDTVNVYVRKSVSPYSRVDSAKVYLSTAGGGVMTFPNAFPDNDYYVQIKHRNSIETWSYGKINFDDPNETYHFIYSQTQAIGNNQKQVDSSPLRYAIYGGDLNQDDVIDSDDISEVENASGVSLSGYVRSDVTGDNYVDASDVSLVENNAANSVSAVSP